MYRLHLQGRRKNPGARNQLDQVAAATSQKTAFFIVTAVKTSNLTTRELFTTGSKMQ
jgi:hypothetical protein